MHDLAFKSSQFGSTGELFPHLPEPMSQPTSSPQKEKILVTALNRILSRKPVFWFTYQTIPTVRFRGSDTGSPPSEKS